MFTVDKKDVAKILVQFGVYGEVSGTEELLRYSLILSADEDLPLEPLCLNDAIEESLAAFYGALTARGVTPDIQIPTAKVVRPLNKAALSRVFGNILGNALKYSGGDLGVTLLETGEAVFSNAAPGLNEVEVGRLFDRFLRGGRSELHRSGACDCQIASGADERNHRSPVC